MKRADRTIIRCISIILLVCLCAASVLYVGGAFEFTFIDRHPSTPQTGSSDSTKDSYISDTLGSTSVGDSITDLFTEITTGSPSTSTTPSSTTGTTNNRYSPPSVSDLLNNGYSITYDNYTDNMVIAEVSLPQIYLDFYTGKAIFRESTLAKNYSDETFRFTELVTTRKDRYTVESYMGYILISTELYTGIYDSTGSLVLLHDSLVSPAYTRDKQNRPLFFLKNTTDFYHIDQEQKTLVLSDYNDEADNRGLYFNYNPSFGVSDNKYSVFYDYADYTRQFSIDLASSWKKANVSHLIAKELYLMYPAYANSVAKANKRFAAALEIAKKELAEESKNNTTSAETTISPETTVSPETSLSPDVTSSPETTIFPDTSSPDTTTSPDTSAPETTSKYPSNSLTGYDTVTKTFHGLRFGFGTSQTKLNYSLKAAKAYAFSEKRAAVVDDYGRLTFINTNFTTSINGHSTFREVIDGAGQSTYYIRNYFEPLYKDERGLGHLYFDDGYVVVRLVDVLSIKNKVIGKDQNVLLNVNGKMITIPDGYTLVTCTEGIMLLERDGRYGYYDPDTQTWIAQPVYTYAQPFYEGIGVIGMEGERIGAIDHNGKIVIPFNYSYVSLMSTGIISVYSADHGWQVFAKLTK